MGLHFWHVLSTREDAATEGVACIAGENTGTENRDEKLRIGLARCVLAACLVLAAFAAGAQAAAQRYEIDIPALRVDAALKALARQTEAQLLFPYDLVKTIQANPVSGRYTLHEALELLLRDTGLSSSLTKGGVITISAAPATAQRDGNGNMMGKKKMSLLGSIAALVGVVIGPHMVRADQADTADQGAKLGEIIVTAQKREQRLQDVPVPVAAISAAALVDSGQLRLQDFSSSVPGLVVQPGAQSTQQLSIRGIAPGSGNPTVGLTVDDVPFGSSISEEGVPDIDPSDLDHIEVLRGPQGTLYGANSLGGLIKFVTVDPSTDRLSGDVQAGIVGVQHGSDPGYSVRGSINVPVSDTFAFRASGFARQDPGYIDNPVLHIDGINKTDPYGGRLSALWKPAENLSLKLSALFQDYRGDGVNDVLVDPPYPPPLGDLQQNYAQRVGPFSRKVQAYSAILHWNFGGIDLTSITGYNVNGFHDSFDLTAYFGPITQSMFGVAGTPLFESTGIKKVSQEIRLASTGRHVDWMLGGFFTHERTHFDQDIDAEDPVSGPLVGSLGTSRIQEAFSEYAGFGNLTFHITDRFDLQTGGRLSHNTQRQDSLGTGILPPETHAASSDSSFTYLLVPQLRLSPNLMVYARIASGYRPGGPNNPAPGVPSTFEPDRTRNYEIGAKGDLFDRAVSFDTSVYYIDWRNIQLSESENVFSYVGNGGRAKSQGVELSMDSHPWTGLTLSGWVALSDAVLTQGVPPAAVAAGTYGASGDRLPLSSRFSGSASVRQAFPLGEAVEGFVGATVTYVGQREGGFLAQGTPRFSVPGYEKIDFHAGVHRDPWSVDVFANNIANKRGLLNGGDGNFPNFAYIYIQPRTLGLSVKRSF